MRLDKFIASHLAISRASAGREIRAGRVTIDGALVKDSAFKLQPQHSVACDGSPLAHISESRYFMLNKPTGYVCAMQDELNPTVLQFLHEPAADKLHSVGRLDKDTSGLLLLTDDGQWSHRVTSPRHHCEKTYLVTLADTVAADCAAQFARGILLRNEKHPTRPARLEIITENQLRLTISEGRYHQVKRMFAAVGNHVLALHRERIGTIILDPTLASGDYRPLTAAEIASV